MTDKQNKTASERPLERLVRQCKMATDCLPNAPYRKGLEGLHKEMLQHIEQLHTALVDLDSAFSFQPSCQTGVVQRCCCMECAKKRARELAMPNEIAQLLRRSAATEQSTGATCYAYFAPDTEKEMV